MSWSLGAPVAALADVGACQFGEEFVACPVLARVEVSADTCVVTFGLADGTKPLNLSTCACILARGGEDKEGKPFIRPYTPVSTNAMVGKFELLVKVYEQGNMSAFLGSVAVGSTVEFKHIPFNVKTQYPFGKKKVGMLVGGTGITPMLQALHAILGTEGDETEVSMLYGSRTADNILAGKELDAWAKDFPRLTVTHVLSAEPADSAWTGARGFISKDLIAAKLPAPADDCVIFICGPPPMYGALCGARGEKEISGVLKEAGFASEQVYKF